MKTPSRNWGGASLYDLVGAGEDRLRHREAELLGGVDGHRDYVDGGYMKAIARITLREMTEDERPDEELSMFPDAHETLDRLKELGMKLALITNGAAEPQRAKLVRFALEQRFDHIQIEGEHGFGKPEERAYKHRAFLSRAVGTRVEKW